MDRWQGKSLIDYAFHVNFMGATPIGALDQIPELIQAGLSELQSLHLQRAAAAAAAPRRTKWISVGSGG